MQTIEFHYEDDFRLENNTNYQSWIDRIIVSENHQLGDVNYIFCNDEYLVELHQKYLNNDDFTDIITFDYVEGNVISGDIFISVDRVRDNAGIFRVDFHQELLRVMSHGLLHLMGYSDKTDEEKAIMRKKENEKVELFHVEQ